MIRIQTIRIQEFRGIRDLTLNLNGQSFAACGPNRSADPRYPGELYAIYLLAEHRGAGIGRALFDEVTGYLRGEALTPFQIWVISGDDTIDHFYENLGGRRVASQPTVVDGADAYEHAYEFARND